MQRFEIDNRRLVITYFVIQILKEFCKNQVFVMIQYLGYCNDGIPWKVKFMAVVHFDRPGPPADEQNTPSGNQKNRVTSSAFLKQGNPDGWTSRASKERASRLGLPTRPITTLSLET